MNITINPEDGTVIFRTLRDQTEEQGLRDFFRFVVERSGVILNPGGIMNTQEGKEFTFKAKELK
jgi:hypothetical protein